MTLPGAMGLIDVTPRMALFGQLFLLHANSPSPGSSAADARAAVEIVSATVPRSTAPGESAAPVFEAAAYLGEWLRGRGLPSSWVAEGPGEPQLQATDATGAIAYVLPLVSVVRVAAKAGYDGLAPLLESVVEDLARPATSGVVADLRVLPESERGEVVRWVRQHLDSGSTSAALARRCGHCGRAHETQIELPDGDAFGWMGAASLAATHLSQAEFECASCGGPPGEQSRFLLLHDEGAGQGHRFLDVLMRGTHTRIASWRIGTDGVATPASE